MAELRIDVYGRPAPQGSKRHVGRGVLVESSRHVKPWRACVRAAAMEAINGRHGVYPLSGPLAVSMVFTVSRPKSHYRTGRNAHLIRDSAPARPAVTPDLSKLIRSTEDALTDAGIWRDDGLVVEYTRAAKVYPNTDPDALFAPGCRITVREVALVPWVRFDDQFPIHRKIEPLSDGAFRLAVCAIFWSSRQLTDGCIPKSDLVFAAPRTMKRPEKFVKELEGAGLWVATSDGWNIHDFLDYQPSKQQVTADRAKTAERQRRWRERHNKAVTNDVSNGVSNAVTNGVTNGAPARPGPSRPVQEANASCESDTLFGPPSQPSKRNGRKKPEAPIPVDFTVTDDMRAWAVDNAPGVDADKVTQKFINHAHANDRRQRDWTAAWRNWLLNERPDQYRPRQATPPVATDFSDWRPET